MLKFPILSKFQCAKIFFFFGGGVNFGPSKFPNFLAHFEKRTVNIWGTVGIVVE